MQQYIMPPRLLLKLPHRIWCALALALQLASPVCSQPQYEVEQIISKLQPGLYAYFDAQGLPQRLFVKDPSGWVEEDPMSLPVKEMPDDIAEELRAAQRAEWTQTIPATSQATIGDTASQSSLSGCQNCPTGGPASRIIDKIASAGSATKKRLTSMGSSLVPTARGAFQIAAPLAALGGATYLASRKPGWLNNNVGARYPRTPITKFNTQSRIYHHPQCPAALRCTVNCIPLGLNEAHTFGGIPCEICKGGNG